MKKLILSLILLALPLSLSADELYQRYLKLGNTYLHAGNFEKADQYFKKSLSMAIDAGDEYWIASGHEYYGYYYSSVGKQKLADEHFSKALKIFKKIIKQKDGSKYAVEELEDRVELIGIFITKSRNACSDGSVLNFDNKKIEDVLPVLPDNPTNLSLSNCRIKDIYFLTDYSSLEFLDLSNNRIKALPRDISDLKNLVTLDLSNNRLKTLPAAELAKMQNLRVLNLKGNKIPFEDIVNLVRLLPNTNISFDEYEIKEDDEEAEY
jgi:tetratricopeptide (TPR) repeat protein